MNRIELTSHPFLHEQLTLVAHGGSLAPVTDWWLNVNGGMNGKRRPNEAFHSGAIRALYVSVQGQSDPVAYYRYRGVLMMH